MGGGVVLEPGCVVCDEPLSALDVSVQAGVLNLLLDLQASRHLAMMFISHDLEVVRHVSDRVIVMYRGAVMEDAPSGDFYRTPRHPYTQVLLGRASPLAEDASEPPAIAAAEATSSRVTRCPFTDRCPMRQERGFRRRPAPREPAARPHAARHL